MFHFMIFCIVASIFWATFGELIVKLTGWAIVAIIAIVVLIVVGGFVIENFSTVAILSIIGGVCYVLVQVVDKKLNENYNRNQRRGSLIADVVAKNETVFDERQEPTLVLDGPIIQNVKVNEPFWSHSKQPKVWGLDAYHHIERSTGPNDQQIWFV